MKAKVLKGGWSYRSVVQQEGDVVEAPAAQVAVWAADGLVEPMDEAPEVERAIAEPEAEQAVAAPQRKGRKKGGK